MLRLYSVLFFLPTLLCAQIVNPESDLRFYILETAEIGPSVGSVLRYVTTHVTYWEADPRAASFWHYPVETLTQKAGDCKDYTTLTMQILHMLGIDSRFIGAEVTDTVSGKTFGHAFLSIGGRFIEPQNPSGTPGFKIKRIFWNWSYSEMRANLVRLRNNGPVETGY